MEIGVVIPTLDEAETVEAALRSIVGSGPGGDVEHHEDAVGPIDVVIADGGSRDETCARARKAGARVIELPRNRGAGRARQLQVGFEACRGEVVLFLHADTRLPAEWARAVIGAMADPAVAGGAFGFRFDRDERPSLLLRAIEWGARVRTARFRLPYGDQALFVRRSVLERIGGVPQVAIMEDLDLVDRIKREGRLALLAVPATTSARRYRARGVLRTFGRNVVALCAWRLDVDRERLARWYRS